MKLGRLLISLVIPFIAGAIGSFFTLEAIPTWYETLRKPFFNPPNSLFGPVWTVLYVFQGIALYLFWNSNKKGAKRRGFGLFAIQIFLNALWSILFFGLKLPLLAFGEIVMLWFFLLLTLQEFKKFDRTASYLFYPYLAWVSFAGILNLSIVLLN
ncbi:MAG TPA: TspO/MBR family protein [Patescibacteria group bacterium]|nr:TspO/MBR family protein [Patescibacteria group bacterium]